MKYIVSELDSKYRGIVVDRMDIIDYGIGIFAASIGLIILLVL